MNRLQSNNSFQKVHTAYTTAPHNHSQHNQTSSHEVLTSLVLVLLMMGIMMPKKCWDWFNSGNIHLIIVASVGSIIHLHFSMYRVHNILTAGIPQSEGWLGNSLDNPRIMIDSQQRQRPSPQWQTSYRVQPNFCSKNNESYSSGLKRMKWPRPFPTI
jgi:hypothetical protein